MMLEWTNEADEKDVLWRRLQRKKLSSVTPRKIETSGFVDIPLESILPAGLVVLWSCLRRK